MTGGAGGRGRLGGAVVALDVRPMHLNPFGLGRYVTNLLRALAEADPDGAYRLLSCGVPPFPLPRGFEVRRVPRNRIFAEQFSMPLAANRARAGLVHYTANHAPVVAPCPLVLTLHDALFLRPWREISERSYLRQRLGAAYRRWTIPRAAMSAAAILTVSAHSKRELLRVLPLVAAERVHVVHEAVDPAFEKPAAAREVDDVRRRLDLRGPYLLALGSFDRRKNIAALLEAFALAAKRPTFGLTLALAGSHKLWATRYRETVERLGIAGRTRFLPLVSDPDLRALFSGATAFAYPSTDEGFGLPVLEAMACGCPVLAARASAIPEVAGDAALYADPTRIDEFASALSRLAADAGLRSRLRSAGLRRAKRFSWARTAEGTLGVYRQVLERRGISA